MATGVGGKIPNPKKRKLVLKTGEGKKYTFSHSPTQISYSGGHRSWHESTRPGRMSAYNHGSVIGRTASFTADVINLERKSITSKLSELRKLLRTKSYVLMEYTAAESGVWVVADFSIDILRRNQNHNPFHASVNITLQEVSSSILPKSPTSGGKSNASKNTTSKSASTSKKIKTHTVVKGDTLWDLSIKYYGTPKKWTKIADKNKIKNPRRLKIGTKLRIP